MFTAYDLVRDALLVARYLGQRECIRFLQSVGANHEFRRAILYFVVTSTRCR
jgi:hypothetical protein